MATTPGGCRMELNTNVRFILDHGSIELLNYMGSDDMILETARVSTGASTDPERDKGLMQFLIRNDHNTPLESCVFRFRVKAPIFVARQWVKHRISSWNEKSARYQEFGDMDFLFPDWKLEGKRGMPTPLTDDTDYCELDFSLASRYADIKLAYNDLISKGIAKEQARVLMPVGAYTEWIWTVNLSSLYNFLKLRTSDHAQYEIRVYANEILNILKELDDFSFATEVIEGMIEFDREVKRLLNIIKDPKLGAVELSKVSDTLLSNSIKNENKNTEIGELNAKN